jgi:hypothetical protein
VNSHLDCINSQAILARSRTSRTQRSAPIVAAVGAVRRVAPCELVVQTDARLIRQIVSKPGGVCVDPVAPGGHGARGSIIEPVAPATALDVPRADQPLRVREHHPGLHEVALALVERILDVPRGVDIEARRAEDAVPEADEPRHTLVPGEPGIHRDEVAVAEPCPSTDDGVGRELELHRRRAALRVAQWRVGEDVALHTSLHQQGRERRQADLDSSVRHLARAIEGRREIHALKHFRFPKLRLRARGRDEHTRLRREFEADAAAELEPVPPGTPIEFRIQPITRLDERAGHPGAKAAQHEVRAHANLPD